MNSQYAVNSMPWTAETDLFDPTPLGSLQLSNRIVMAPLTRSRAGEDGTATAMMAEYYAQRASAGLIIAEGTNISAEARGYANTPALYKPEQVNAWKRVTNAVHAKGGQIFVQLWHVGRVSHPSLQPQGLLPVAPSAIAPRATVFTAQGYQPCVTPRALRTAEIPQIVEQYRTAAFNAMAAGFDGVEIHAANGYLLEQFLRDSTNKRTDKYGGSLQNRARLLLEVAAAVVKACAAGRVGIRLSPLSTVNDMALDSDPAVTYSYVVDQLNELGLAYIHVIEGETQGAREVAGGFDLQILRERFKGRYIANNGYELVSAAGARRYNYADFIAFGRLYIANPDLVDRFKTGATLNSPDRATYFGGAEKGYIDYPMKDGSV